MTMPIPPSSDAGHTGLAYQRVLPMDCRLGAGDCIAAANGMFFARLDADGQLRVYRGQCSGQQHGVLWASGSGAESGRFFAQLQADGNFCVCRGDGPAGNQGRAWSTGATAGGGQFHAVLNNDGSLCVCAGSDPAIDPLPLWSSGATDAVTSIDAIEFIDYDLGAGLVMASRPSDLYRETVSNHHSQVQARLICGSVTVSHTTGWSDELARGTAAAAAAGFKGPVPVVSGGRLVLSADAGRGYRRNAAATTDLTWGFSAPALVPPNASMMCVVTALRSAIIVPYVLYGSFTLASGCQLRGRIEGTYSGTNCHDLGVTLTTWASNPASSHTVVRPLTPMPTISGSDMPHPIRAGAFD
jgi:hypothetical protein